MSLLDNAEGFEPVTVYPEETYIDRDGNTMSRASSTGIPSEARWQIQSQSGTSARRAEQQMEGFSVEAVYFIRFPRGFEAEHGVLGAQAKVKRTGDGRTYGIFGDALVYNASPRTAHNIYTVRAT